MKYVQNNYKVVKNIVDQLELDDKKEICNGDFADSPYVIYREAITDNDGNGLAFIDLYQTEDMNNVAIVIARKQGSEYSNRGYASLLVKRAANIANQNNWSLVWPVSENNIRSIKLAEKFNINMEIKKH